MDSAKSRPNNNKSYCRTRFSFFLSWWNLVVMELTLGGGFLLARPNISDVWGCLPEECPALRSRDSGIGTFKYQICQYLVFLEIIQYFKCCVPYSFGLFRKLVSISNIACRTFFVFLEIIQYLKYCVPHLFGIFGIFYGHLVFLLVSGDPAQDEQWWWDGYFQVDSQEAVTQFRFLTLCIE